MNRSWPPLVGAFVAVAVVQVVLFQAWGTPPLRYDEVGYQAAADGFTAWAGDGFPTPIPADVGRIAVHNPGYGAVAGLIQWLSGTLPGPLRLLQLLAGLLTGLVVFHALRRRVPETWALVGALAVWLHPSALFFRLTLWPTAFATGLVALVLLCALRLADDPDDRSRQWALGLTFAPLPFFAAPSLALLPALLAWPGPRRGWRVAVPAAALWIPWMLGLSLLLQTFTPMDTSGPCNVALGNHELIRADASSLWGSLAERESFEALRASACRHRDPLAELRCEARWCKDVAAATVASDPGAAAGRALLRVGATWQVDAFAVRHFELIDRGVPAGLEALVTASHFGLLALALVGLRTREGRAAWIAIALWTVPVLLSVGFTRIRQPLLPVLVFAATAGVDYWKAQGSTSSSSSGSGSGSGERTNTSLVRSSS
ncbi:MAG: hypothetical protein GY898_09260 [Proteobacteria bacterium]|nr:hypothetical protein [Pseudomonadota bacterium]